MKILSAAALFILTLLLWSVVHQYLFCTRFTFSDPQPFHGPRLYNPYAQMDSSNWVMCNFHAHSNAWKGVTNGEGTTQDIWNVYDSLGYGVHLTSDYHKIDFTHEYEKNFIPAYEQGFNLKKVHYLVLGNLKVNWLDYPLPQILSNKQKILNHLTADESLVILNHPDVRNGFSRDDLKYLSGYRYMEVLSPYSTSVDKWDAALSAGKPIFIAGNDDAHNVFDHQSVGKFCTLVNTKNVTKKTVLESMKIGNTYGMQIPEIPDEDLYRKSQRLKTQLPKLQNVRLIDDIVHVNLNKAASVIIFSGQNGKELSRIVHSTHASYAIQKNDPYVRTSIIFTDGTKIFLNPIFRYTDVPFIDARPQINWAKTYLLNFFGLLILLFWGLFWFKFLFKGKLKRGVIQLPKWIPG